MKIIQFPIIWYEKHIQICLQEAWRVAYLPDLLQTADSFAGSQISSAGIHLFAFAVSPCLAPAKYLLIFVKKNTDFLEKVLFFWMNGRLVL
jgi:hypothetical protein